MSIKNRKQSGFSLVEISLSIGIVAFAFMSVFGMISTGLSTFHKAVDTSVASLISQRVLNDVKQTDFDQLTTPPGTQIPETRPDYTFQAALRYFDDQGNEVIPANPQPDSLSATEKSKIIYWVNTRVTTSPTLPTAATNSQNPHLSTITIQIANNPMNTNLNSLLVSGRPDDTSTPLRNLWKTAASVQLFTYWTVVAKND